MTPRAFPPLYFLANLGAHLAFLPLLVLLLPRRVEAIAVEEPIILLSKLLLVGGLVASLANIAAGWFSDRWINQYGNRRGPIALGLIFLLASYVYIATALTPWALLIGIIAFQTSLNLMFAPVGALLADHVAHEKKGLMAGWLNMALPLAGLGITLIGKFSDEDAAWPFLLLAAAIALLVLPLVMAWPRGLKLIEKPIEKLVETASLTGDFLWAWIARLTVQTGAAIMLSYLYLYVSSLSAAATGYPDQSVSEGVASLSLIATIMSLGAGILAGRWSDKAGQRKRPLIFTALGISVAMGLLAWGGNWWVVLFAYALFTASLTAFLSVDSALVAQLLSGHKARGTFLGLMNLTNTLPAIIAPAAALLLSTSGLEIGVLRMLLAMGVLAGIIAALSVSRIRSIA